MAPTHLHVKFGAGRPPPIAAGLPFAHDVDPARDQLPDTLKTDVQREGVLRYLRQNFPEGSYVFDVVHERESDGMYVLVTKNWARSVGDSKLHLSLYVYQEDSHVATWHAYTDRSISYSREGDENDPPPEGDDPYSTPEALATAGQVTSPAPPPESDDRPRFDRPAAAPDSDEEGVEPPFDLSEISKPAVPSRSKRAEKAASEDEAKPSAATASRSSRSSRSTRRTVPSDDEHSAAGGDHVDLSKPAYPIVKSKPVERSSDGSIDPRDSTVVRGDRRNKDLDIPAGGEATLLDAKRRSDSKSRSSRRSHRSEPREVGFDPVEVQQPPTAPPPKPTAKEVIGGLFKSVHGLIAARTAAMSGQDDAQPAEDDDEAARAARKAERAKRREKRAARRAARDEAERQAAQTAAEEEEEEERRREKEERKRKKRAEEDKARRAAEEAERQAREEKTRRATAAAEAQQRADAAMRSSRRRAISPTSSASDDDRKARPPPRRDEPDPQRVPWPTPSRNLGQRGGAGARNAGTAATAVFLAPAIWG
ncbi:hypothetical protein Rhopal_001138-T1 [Rhodotorula paludigena]|uniref:Uncharacterized protein n=1 Tax=Rhodotorula paludigena TaxID=86838 RepID=A0AAV5GCZ5_9BASI|nr:hypothetical protein Rhopal_001138-T1 [Rhodotorula paludigena]